MLLRSSPFSVTISFCGKGSIYKCILKENGGSRRFICSDWARTRRRPYKVPFFSVSETQCAWGEATHPTSLVNVSGVIRAQRGSEEKANNKTFRSYPVTVRTRCPVWEYPEGAVLSQSYTGCFEKQLYKLPMWKRHCPMDRGSLAQSKAFGRMEVYLVMLQQETTSFLWSGHFFSNSTYFLSYSLEV